jgi:CRP-like cAMP-binding protein
MGCGSSSPAPPAASAVSASHSAAPSAASAVPASRSAAEPARKPSAKTSRPDHLDFGAFVHAYETGGIFGELALITNQPRAVTVVCESDVSCYCIAQDAFDRIVDVKNLFASNLDTYKDYSESALANSHVVEEEISDGPKEDISPSEAEAEQNRIAAFKAASKRGRRGTVFVVAEAPVQNFVPPVHEKSAEQSNKLLELLEGAKLLKYLDASSKLTVVQALFSKTAPASTDVIKQGDEGDLFYILESGSADVFIKKGDEEAKMVTSYAAGAVFGELALMYGEPRAATVTTTSDCLLWCLDRTTFKNIMMKQNSEQYGAVKFLDKVPIFKPLSMFEKTRFAEALSEVSFPAGKVAIKQGDKGDCCYIVKSGTLVCYKK